MAVKTIYFFVFILFLSIISSTTIDTRSISKNKLSKTPALEFGVFEAYRIREDGIKEALIADKGLHYETQDILYKGFIFAKDDNGIKSIDGDKIIITKTTVSIYGNGHFIDSDSHELYSENAVYDIDNQFLTGEGNFTAIIKDNVIKGKDLLVDGKSRIIRGFDINAKIETE